MNPLPRAILLPMYSDEVCTDSSKEKADLRLVMHCKSHFQILCNCNLGRSGTCSRLGHFDPSPDVVFAVEYLPTHAC